MGFFLSMQHRHNTIINADVGMDTDNCDNHNNDNGSNIGSVCDGLHLINHIIVAMYAIIFFRGIWISPDQTPLPLPQCEIA